MEKETVGILLAVGIVILLGAALFWCMWRIVNKAQEFFDLSDELEDLIRTKDNKNIQLKCLYELKKLSFHKNTSNRLRELAKMMELKYEIQILRR